RRRQQPGSGVGARDPAARARAALDDHQRPQIPRGEEPMSVASAPGKPTAGRRIARIASRGLVNAILLIVAVFWLVPTIGLLLTSFRSAGDNASSGWWTVLTK